MMRWLILVLVLSFLSLLIAAGGMVLHVRRLRKQTLKAKEIDAHAAANSDEDVLIEP